MIKLLRITNLAVISHLQVEFGSGLNILTGETGAGKSIILAALGLLLGDRASQDMLRTGETRSSVEGVFEIEGNEPLAQLLENSGIESDGRDLILKREINAVGRGRIFVNNQAATLNLLKAIQPHIIDVHGQGEQQSLLSPSVQTTILDSYAECLPLRQRVGGVFDRISEIVKQLEGARRSESERLQMLDLISYQIKEIEEVSPKIGEDLDLEAEKKILLNAETLTSYCDDVLRLLYDEDDAVIGKLSLAGRRLDALTSINEELQAQCDQLTSVKYLIEDIVFAVRGFSQSITFSPQRLEALNERLSSLDRLKRKYGGTIEELINHLSLLRVKYSTLTNSAEVEEVLHRDLRTEIESYIDLASSLSRIRKKAAQQLEKLLKKDLSEVALEKSEFKILFNRPTSTLDISQANQGDIKNFQEITFSKIGKESADFYFSANQGETPRLLSSVASGGELSRLMLILKTNIAPTPYPRTLVFDEIDTGIGGRVADAVGVRLHRLAKSNQVLCVTHQAQIARYADIHLQVSKEERGQRTITTVTPLDTEGRISEIARMMAGTDVTEVTRKHALELLQYR